MPDLRDIDARDVTRAFERAGGVARFGKGDHVNIKMPNGMVLTLSSARGPVKTGILRAMLRKAGLTPEEFLRLLGRGD